MSGTYRARRDGPRIRRVLDELNVAMAEERTENMGETDPPVVNLKKALKKLDSAQRNCAQAGKGELVTACVELKQRIVEAMDAERVGAGGPRYDPRDPATWPKGRVVCADKHCRGKTHVHCNYQLCCWGPAGKREPCPNRGRKYRPRYQVRKVSVGAG